jgi:hypothetical protein
MWVGKRKFGFQLWIYSLGEPVGIQDEGRIRRSVLTASGINPLCATDGRIRYSQLIILSVTRANITLGGRTLSCSQSGEPQMRFLSSVIVSDHVTLNESV